MALLIQRAHSCCRCLPRSISWSPTPNTHHTLPPAFSFYSRRSLKSTFTFPLAAISSVEEMDLPVPFDAHFLRINTLGRVIYLALPTEPLRNIWVAKITAQMAVVQAGMSVQNLD